MVGRTNIPFISKGEGSSVQLIQKSYVTDATTEIYKMELINEKIFVFVSSNTVMSGQSMNGLEFVKKDNENLKATHIIHKDGNYYIICEGKECLIYKTSDFVTYELVETGETIGSEISKGIFVNTRGEVVLVTRIKNGSPSDNRNTEYFSIRICETVEGLKIVKEVRTRYGYVSTGTRTYMRDNRIFWDYGGKGLNTIYGGQISLNGDYIESKKYVNFYNYAGGYFFITETIGQQRALYRMRDGINATLQCYLESSFEKERVVPINGKFVLLYKEKIGDSSKNQYVNYANVADDILSVGASENIQIEIVDDLEYSSVLEYDGKTYIGTKNGIIYEFQLDYEGTMQRPDVTIIKTLAAKQALAESLQYTDSCIATLKKYVDDKMQETVPVEKNNSTEVEPVENMD